MKTFIVLILTFFVIISTSGCTSTVHFPDGKFMQFNRAFGVRNFSAEMTDKEAKKEYKVKADNSIKLPTLSLLTFPK